MHPPPSLCIEHVSTPTTWAVHLQKTPFELACLRQLRRTTAPLAAIPALKRSRQVLSAVAAAIQVLLHLVLLPATAGNGLHRCRLNQLLLQLTPSPSLRGQDELLHRVKF